MNKLFFQLYSARNTDLDEALQIVADAGYTGIEAYRENFNDIPAFKAALNKHGLSLPSMHINLNLLRDDMSGCIERAKSFDCEHIVCPFLNPEDRPSQADQWQTLGRELAEIEQRWKDVGCTFAWHNHDFEFIALEDGSLPIEHLLETADSMTWEIDVAWIVRAEVDPEAWIKRYQSRISAVHLKDVAPSGECEDEGGWADLGEGNVPWPRLIQLLKQSPTDLYFAEHDDPSDLIRFANRSINAAKTLLN